MKNAQHSLDRQRRTYRVAFPSDVRAQDVTAWLRQVASGFHTPPEGRAYPALLFEVVSIEGEIQHFVTAPWKDADHVTQQLHGHVPGINALQQDERPSLYLTYGDEFEMDDADMPLDVQTDVEHRYISALNSMNRLNTGEVVVAQWVVRPLYPTELPRPRRDRFWLRDFRYHEQTDRALVSGLESKNAEPNFAVSLRIGSRANTDARAFQLVGNTYRSMTSGHGFRPVKKSDPASLARVISLGQSPRFYTDRLTASELTALLAWPLSSRSVHGVTRDAARLLPVGSDVLASNDTRLANLGGGVQLGVATHNGRERQVSIDYESLTMHAFITGSNGTGKTSYMGEMARTIMEDNHGLVVIDPKDDLYNSVRNNVPKHRLEDVINIDFSDPANHVGFNVFEQGDPSTAIQDLVDLIDHKYRGSSGPLFYKYMYHGLHTLASRPGLTFNDLSPLLMPRTPDERAWAEELGKSMKEPEFKHFWSDHWKNPKREQDVQSTLNRIWQLISRPETRYFLGQGTSSFDIMDVVRGNKILLVNVAPLDKGAQELVGTIILNALWAASRNVSTSDYNFLMMDEFQLFADLPFGFDDLVSLARRFHLCIVAATQDSDRLRQADRSGNLERAVMVNARNKIVFNTTGQAARDWQRFFAGEVKESDIVKLQNYYAISQVKTPTGVSDPFTIKTNPPRTPYGSREKVTDMSIAKYTRTAEQVRAEETARRTTKRARKLSDADALRLKRERAQR